jgi:hypothetical protein
MMGREIPSAQAEVFFSVPQSSVYARRAGVPEYGDKGQESGSAEYLC